MSTAQPIDVRDMAIVHTTFRTAYEECARLVRAAPAPSPGRVTFLADHIDFSIAVLHIHHEGEDELLYPKLIERVPGQAPMTEQIRLPAAPRLAGIVAAADLLTGVVSAVFSPVTATSASSHRAARGSAWKPPRASVGVRPVP